MSDVLQEIKGYLGSIEHNVVFAENATPEKYEMYKKTVIDCKEAVLYLFQKLDREYWELLERFGQSQTKVERYEKALELIYKDTFYESEHDLVSPIHVIRKRAEKALEGDND